MSFWLEDDDDPYTQQSQSQSQNASFECENCGSTQSYLDNTTGQQVCSVCFTQSISQTQESTMEYEDIVGLAAKTKSGALVKRKQPQFSQKRKSQKRPLSEVDRTVPFPNVDQCIQGLQQILKVCIERLTASLLHLDSNRQDAVRQTTKTLWMTYMKSWADGAEYYGRQHPDIRFSFRDCFILNPTHRKLILRHLSYQAVQAMDKDSKTAKSDESSSLQRRPRILESEEEQNEGQQDTLETSAKKNANRLNAIRKMIQADTLGQRKGRKEVALVLQPSMTFAAAMLYISVARAGVSSSKIIEWIANGSLPLLQAFRCLKPKQQRELQPIASFFRLDKPPTVTNLEYTAHLLTIACGLQTPEIFSGMSEKLPLNSFRFLSISSVPVIAAQVIADCGLGQRILDLTLALLGLARRHATAGLPTSMTNPEQMHSLAHILAVIACACQLDDQWRSWTVVGQHQTKIRKMDRLVPWNECQLRQVGNGPMLEGYLDFLEESIIDPNETLAPELFNKLEATSDANLDFLDGDHSPKVRVRPCTTIATVRDDKEALPDYFRQRIFQASRKKEKEVPPNLVVPLDPQQKLLIEFLAHSNRIDASQIESALRDLI